MLLTSALVALGATLAAAVTPLEVRGNQFVNPKSGTRFQVVGMAYQPGGSAGYSADSGWDPLSNGTTCMRDAALMQILGINTIRVYNLNPNLNHDECASIFNAAGIYMMLDVNSPLMGESLKSDEPWTTYYKGYLNRTFAVVEAFKSFPNTLVYFSGNEVIDKVENGKTAAPYIRAVTRDLKQYIAKHSTRKIPVGYSAADVRSVLYDSFHYFECALDGKADDPSRADIFALNSYSWCGNSSFQTSGYDQLLSDFTNTSIPVYFSEYGCNDPAPRIFTEVPALYSDQMTGVMSGGIVYEYVQEVNNYGLVDIKADSSIDLLRDYYTLKDQYAKVNFATVQGIKAATTIKSPPKCDPSLISDDGFNNNFTIPVIPVEDGSAELLEKGVSPAPVGKLVQISDWKVKNAVRNPDGSALTGLEVKPLPDDGTDIAGLDNPASVTGGGGAGTGTSSGSGASPSPTGKNSAFSIQERAPLAIAMALVMSTMTVFFAF